MMNFDKNKEFFWSNERSFPRETQVRLFAAIFLLHKKDFRCDPGYKFCNFPFAKTKKTAENTAVP